MVFLFITSTLFIVELNLLHLFVDNIDTRVVSNNFSVAFNIKDLTK